MTTDSKKPGVAFWTTVACLALLAYGASLGPGCWLSSRFGGMHIVSHVYRPITWIAEISGSDSLMGMLQAYSALGSTDDATWAFSVEHPGKAEWESGWFSISIGGTIELPLRVVVPLLENDEETQEQ